MNLFYGDSVNWYVVPVLCALRGRGELFRTLIREPGVIIGHIKRYFYIGSKARCSKRQKNVGF